VAKSVDEMHDKHFSPRGGICIFLRARYDKANHITTLCRHTYHANGLNIEIPTGFDNDLGSIPWFMTWLYHRFDPHRRRARPFLYHDFLYRSHRYSRGLSDWICREMLSMDMSGWQQWLVWLTWFALRLFGGKAWRKNGENLQDFKEGIALLDRLEGMTGSKVKL